MVEPITQTSCEDPHNTLHHGVSVCPGLAAGPVFLYSDILDHDHMGAISGASDPSRELDRLHRAEEQVREDLERATEFLDAEAGNDVGSIFRAHEMILTSPGLRKEIETSLIEEGMSAEAAIQNAFRKREQRFLDMADPMFRQRAEDLVDIARRLLRGLVGIEHHSLENFPTGRILVTRKLYASEIVFLGRGRSAAIVTEAGSPGSHVAVLAQAMGIPAVTRMEGITATATDGEYTVVLDTDLDDGLRREGIARDVINLLNNVRKDQGFAVSDRVQIAWTCDDAAVAAQ